MHSSTSTRPCHSLTISPPRNHVTPLKRFLGVTVNRAAVMWVEVGLSQVSPCRPPYTEPLRLDASLWWAGATILAPKHSFCRKVFFGVSHHKKDVSTTPCLTGPLPRTVLNQLDSAENGEANRTSDGVCGAGAQVWHLLCTPGMPHSPGTYLRRCTLQQLHTLTVFCIWKVSTALHASHNNGKWSNFT